MQESYFTLTDSYYDRNVIEEFSKWTLNNI